MFEGAQRSTDTRELQSKKSSRSLNSTRRSRTGKVSVVRAASNQQLQRELRERGIQPNLTVNEPDDEYEKEADRVAEKVMRMPDPAPAVTPRNNPPTEAVQRLCPRCRKWFSEGKPLNCPACQQELHRKEGSAEAPTLDREGRQAIQSLRGRGKPLPDSVRSFFEPRFGEDFVDVRIHTGREPRELARSLGARAFTIGRDVVFGAGEYAPARPSGRRLLAHELTHVVQQTRSARTLQRFVRLREPATLRRLTIHNSCQGYEKTIQDAWKDASALANSTVDALASLKRVAEAGRDPAEVMPTAWGHLENAFGTVRGLHAAQGGGVVFFGQFDKILNNFQKIAKAFSSGNGSLRCDTTQVLAQIGKTELCNIHSAFVLENAPKQYEDWMFLCPKFLPPSSRSNRSRALVLIHEMAHSLLGVDHKGGRVVEFTCDSLDLPYKDAIDNAYAYDHLAKCLHGGGEKDRRRGQKEGTRKKKTSAGPSKKRPWTLAAMGGISLSDREELRGLWSLSAERSLRTGSLVVFNPTIGLNVLHVPGTTATSEQLAAAMIDVGLRLQQPLEGFYFDVSGGGFGGVRFDPGAGRTRPTAGLGTTLGAGWRFERLEIGAEASGLFPLTSEDQSRVLILGKVGLRF